MLRGSDRYRLVNVIGLNDFHGQLDQTTTPIDGLNVPVGGAAQLATMFDEEAGALPGETLLLAAGDNVGASPPNSALLDDHPAIDVENAWGMDATSYGNHEFDFGVARILEHLDRADFPFLSANIVEEGPTDPPSWLDRSAVFDVNGVRVGVIGATVQTTPELVRADATAGLEFIDEAEAIAAESERLRSRGVQVQIVVIHEGAVLGAEPHRRPAGGDVGGPDHPDRRSAPGHDGRPRHRRPHPPHRQHRRGPHPRRRRRQRRRQLLRGPARWSAEGT